MTTLAELKEELVLMNAYWRKRNLDVVPDDPIIDELEERTNAFLARCEIKTQIKEIEDRIL